MSVNYHQSFEFVKEQHISSLNIDYQEFKHIKTGAQHIHLASETDENVFMTALRTIPQDSTGVAHILEHCALNGSEKFPVKKPFMSMSNRSLKTYMNAITYPDYTAYPFATQNRKDFDNLLQVYLDAIFFPKLESLVFAQEGHRLDFSEQGNTNSPLIFKGVVFNEMKGALSADSAQLYQHVTKHLYPTVTYHHNSGGDPENITDLTYEDFKAFYQRHYHPSNATFITFGNIPAVQHQQRFEELALHRFDKQDLRISVPEEQRYQHPVYEQDEYAVGAEQGTDDKTYVTLSWLLGTSTDVEEVIKAQLISQLLVGNSSAPLTQALESSGLGSGLAPVTGLNHTAREMCFTCGISGTNPDKADEVEALIMKVLHDVAENGLPLSTVEANLHQFELSQREIPDGYPYGIQLAMRTLPKVIHYGDPIESLDLDGVLSDLQRKVKEPSFVKQAVKELFIENQHRLRFVMKPDTSLGAKNTQKEKDKLAAIARSLTDTEKQQIVDTATQLEQRQNRQENKDLLPKVTVSDIPPELNFQAPAFTQQKPLALTAYEAGTNGLTYQNVIMPLPALTKQESELLNLYSWLVANLGVGELDYTQADMAKNAILKQLTADVSFQADKSDANKTYANLTFTACGLVRNHKAICEFIQNTLTQARFDETARIAELVNKYAMHIEMGITQSGHLLAMLAAASGISNKGYLDHFTSSLHMTTVFKQLKQKVSTKEGLQTLSDELTALHQKIMAMPRQVLLVAESDNLKYLAELGQQAFGNAQMPDNYQFSFELSTTEKQVAFVANTQVNFCAKAFPTVSMTHPDTPKLVVLAKIMRSNFLHQAIRERGGAYGTGAMQDMQSASFKLFSYRDPRLTETLTDFDNAVEWAKTAVINEEDLEEAIISVIGDIDKPLAPAAEAIYQFNNELNGFDKATWETFRQGVLAVTANDLNTVANIYLDTNHARTAVITNTEGAAQSGFSRVEL